MRALSRTHDGWKKVAHELIGMQCVSAVNVSEIFVCVRVLWFVVVAGALRLSTTLVLALCD